jgi:hypothetical protein
VGDVFWPLVPKCSIGTQFKDHNGDAFSATLACQPHWCDVNLGVAGLACMFEYVTGS